MRNDGFGRSVAALLLGVALTLSLVPTQTLAEALPEAPEAEADDKREETVGEDDALAAVEEASAQQTQDDDAIDAEQPFDGAQVMAEDEQDVVQGGEAVAEPSAEQVESASDDDLVSQEAFAEEPSIDSQASSKSGPVGTCVWTLFNGVLTIEPANGVSGVLPKFDELAEFVEDGTIVISEKFWWMDYLDPKEVTSIVFKKGVKVEGSIRGMLSSYHRYTDLRENKITGFENVRTIDLSGLDTSKATSLQSMFWCLKSLETIDVGSLDTSNVTNMCGLFHACTALKEIKNLDKLDTSHVTDMREMFEGDISLTSLDLRSFDTSQVEKMSYMFAGCRALSTLDLSSFDMSNVGASSVSYMFDQYRSAITKIAVGPKFSAALAFPAPHDSSGGRWWSTKDHKWYTQNEVR